MEEQSVICQPIWRIIKDSSYAPFDDPLASFAVDDVLCESIGTKKAPATARSWVHTNAIVLGIQDTRLPDVRRARDVLEARGWGVIVRNSGGLAVVLDEGIYNLSLVLNEKQNRLTIDRGYETMVELLVQMLAPFDIDFTSGEIVGSYCPGRYDLSVSGKKFAGISQRRIRGGVSIQTYLCVEGSGAERAKVVKEFYERAGKCETDRYPTIQPETMASLSELAGKTITTAHLDDQLDNVLGRFGKIEHADLTKHEESRFNLYYERVQARNKKALA